MTFKKLILAALIVILAPPCVADTDPETQLTLEVIQAERKELAILIRAATRWIDASRPAERETGIMQRLKGMLPAITGKGGANRV